MQIDDIQYKLWRLWRRWIRYPFWSWPSYKISSHIKYHKAIAGGVPCNECCYPGGIWEFLYTKFSLLLHHQIERTAWRKTHVHNEHCVAWGDDICSFHEKQERIVKQRLRLCVRIARRLKDDFYGKLLDEHPLSVEYGNAISERWGVPMKKETKRYRELYEFYRDYEDTMRKKADREAMLMFKIMTENGPSWWR